MLKIKAKKRNTALPSEGTHDGIVTSVKAKPSEEQPKKITIGFKAPGFEPELFKDYPAKMEQGSSLRIDVEKLMGEPFTESEAEDGPDLGTVVGKTCQIVVAHKGGPGGKPIAAVTVVLPATNDAPLDEDLRSIKIKGIPECEETTESTPSNAGAAH